MTSSPSPRASRAADRDSRRDFLTQLAAAGLAVAGTACTRAVAPVAGAPVAGAATGAASATAGGARQRPAPITFDDSWTERVRAAKHKAVFDSPEIADGIALFQAWVYRDGYQKALGAAPGDVVPILVLRHAATVLTFDDPVWEKYDLGRLIKLHATDDQGRKTKRFVATNPYSRPHTAEERRSPQFMLEGLIASGVVVLACNNAFMGITSRMARAAGADVEAVRAEVRAGMLKGATLQPSGIYATARAQEVGAVFMKSS